MRRNNFTAQEVHWKCYIFIRKYALNEVIQIHIYEVIYFIHSVFLLDQRIDALQENLSG